MRYGFLVFFLITLVLIDPLFAQGEAVFDSYTQTVELGEKNSFHKIDAFVDVKNEMRQLNLTLPPRVKKLKVLVNEEEISCLLEEKEGFTLLDCSLPEDLVGMYFIELSYETTYPIFELENRILYKSDYVPTQLTDSLFYILKLPVGYVLPEEKDISFFVDPEPKSIYSDGRRIILSWQVRNVSSTFELSVLMEPVNGSSFNTLSLIGGLIFLGLIVSVLKAILSNRRKLDVSYPALVEHERVVVELLKNSEGNILWQKQIQHKTGFSKVKVSRVIRSLEERGVIKKEPWGNTNKIHLVLENEEEAVK
jgi:uncharacterized membrane protein